jgi:hypothetical protein
MGTKQSSRPSDLLPYQSADLVARPRERNAEKPKNQRFRGLRAQPCPHHNGHLPLGEQIPTPEFVHTERTMMMIRLPMMIGMVGTGLLIGVLSPAVANATTGTGAAGATAANWWRPESGVNRPAEVLASVSDATRWR